MGSQAQQEESVNFIKHDLLPEMVHNRCFCESGSREFVEFDTATVEPLILPAKSPNSCEIYRANVTVNFSGEPHNFPLIVKLLPRAADHATAAFDAFQNEEMFYSKMTLIYGTDFTPKCYLSDLGRYGRPVIVLEDLGVLGYRRVNGKLDEDHLKLCVKLLATIHSRGLKLKSEKFALFREFYAKLLEITFNEAALEYYEPRNRRFDFEFDICDSVFEKIIYGCRISNLLTSSSDSKVAEKIIQKLGERPLDTARNLALDINEQSTLCHGCFSMDNLLFKYDKEKPIDVKVIDWQTIRYCSPAIDLGPLLLDNLAFESLGSRMPELLSLYIDFVQRECPEIERNQLKADIIRKLPFACFILSSEETATDEQLLQVLLHLQHLGAFD